jgi:predicted ArsR family transcriptional regulator
MPHRRAIRETPVLATSRACIGRLFIDLERVLRQNVFGDDTRQEADIGTMVLIVTAVMEGHAEGRPMTATRLEKRLDIPHGTMIRKLANLVEMGQVARDGGEYFMTPKRRTTVPPEEMRERYKQVLTRALVELMELGYLTPSQPPKMDGRSHENPVKDATPSAFVHDNPLYNRARIAYIRLYIETWKLHTGRIFEKAPEKSSEATGCVIVSQCVTLGSLEGKPWSASKIARELRLPPRTVRNKLKLLMELDVVERGRGKHRGCYIITDQFRAMPRPRAMKYRKIFMTALNECLPAMRAAGDLQQLGLA